VRGRTGQFPFSPGGLDGIADEANGGDRYRINEKTQLGPLPSIPPGFSRGLKIKSTEEDMDLENTELDNEEVGEEVVRSVHVNAPAATTKANGVQTGFEGIDDLLPDEVFPPLCVGLTCSSHCWHHEDNSPRPVARGVKNGLTWLT